MGCDRCPFEGEYSFLLLPLLLGCLLIVPVSSDDESLCAQNPTSFEHDESVEPVIVVGVVGSAVLLEWCREELFDELAPLPLLLLLRNWKSPPVRSLSASVCGRIYV